MCLCTEICCKQLRLQDVGNLRSSTEDCVSETIWCLFFLFVCSLTFDIYVSTKLIFNTPTLSLRNYFLKQLNCQTTFAFVRKMISGQVVGTDGQQTEADTRHLFICFYFKPLY